MSTSNGREIDSLRIFFKTGSLDGDVFPLVLRFLSLGSGVVREVLENLSESLACPLVSPSFSTTVEVNDVSREVDAFAFELVLRSARLLAWGV